MIKTVRFDLPAESCTRLGQGKRASELETEAVKAFVLQRLPKSVQGSLCNNFYFIILMDLKLYKSNEANR